MQSIKRHNTLLLALILVVGIVLRTYNFLDIPFSHDEFSAFFRTKFDNIYDLIAYGARIDGHPAGIQVFLYYWIQFFGPAEWVVKLPFIVFGLLSILLIYKLGKFWFNETVGLLCAALMAVSQFPVMYSQIARPYISGLFFSLLMVWYWSKIINNPNKGFWRNGIGFVLAASLCTYNHHFSMLFAAIVGFCGLFLLNRKFIWKYLLLGVFVCLLYLPHLEILFHQMSMKGVEGWLAKPEKYFILDFLRYLFNYSWWFIAIVLGIVLFGLYNDKRQFSRKKYLLFATLFFLPFLIGFFYSVYVSAVLQFSVLIFSYPFFYFLLFGHFKNLSFKRNLMLVGLIVLIGTTSLVFERKHYQVFYKDHFENVLLDFHDAKKVSSDLAAYIDTRKDIIYYYADRHGLSTDFRWHDDFNSVAETHAFIYSQSQKHDYFYLGVNARFNPLLLSMVQEYFPYMVFKRDYFIGTHFLFTKERPINELKNRVLISQLDFQKIGVSNPYWRHIQQDRLTENGYQMDADLEWSPTFECSVDSIINHRNDFIEVKVEYTAEKTINKAVLVMVIDKGDENVYWLGLPLNHTQFGDFDSSISHKAFAALKLSDIKNFSGGNLKVFVWNEGREDFIISEISIFKSGGNPIIYGLFEPI